jgi:hypothetical protein
VARIPATAIALCMWPMDAPQKVVDVFSDWYDTVRLSSLSSRSDIQL